MNENANGKIITFYSYKGGTGRSMLLANIAWILASNGKRVLVIDWDLEAPGLHRYFHPFLLDKDLYHTPGLIDLLRDYENKAITPVDEDGEQKQEKWCQEAANLARDAVAVRWAHFHDGSIEFIGAGKQDLHYSRKVNLFNWDNFYDRLGGGTFFTEARERLKEQYDYILIDSRTGVSDISGICTLQMPDVLLMCFTPNTQSIEGASAVAKSVFGQWERRPDLYPGKRQIWPVLTRVDLNELNKLEIARTLTRTKFSRYLHDIPATERDTYWGKIEIPYVPYFAFEEVLAVFKDKGDEELSLLAPMQRLTSYLTDGKIERLVAPPEEERLRIIDRFEREYIQEEHDAFVIPLGLEKISLAKLPPTNPELFGRDKELKMLDEVWDNTGTNIICFVAWGGVGKTALVNTWLSKMRQHHFRGAERVFGWSFYSPQGAAEGKPTSADQFIASALKWFGDPKPDAGSPWEKGERLAEYIRKQKTLLILDGLDQMQHPFRGGEGSIMDPGLQSLVRELANHNPGLCVITTRLDVDDLKDFVGTTVANIHLEYLSDEAGLELLKYLGVKGTDDELKQAVREFDGHALALMLLGNYLSIAYKGDVEKRDRIAKLTKEKKYGSRARQVMESYEIWLKGQPELDILRIMGLFDRPAEAGAIEVLIATPPIKGLTTKLMDLPHDDWQFALINLRKAGLLQKEDPAMPDNLDCHSLIREHFCDELKENNLEAWKEAHYRLYEYFKKQAKEYPDTIEEMSPLYAAVAHGCQAGRYLEAFDAVYRQRIQRKNKYFNLHKLGAFGTDLAALSGFFDSLWDKPVVGLTEADKAYVLGVAGFDLRALGRLKEAVQPMQAGLEAMIVLEDLNNAARSAGNLSELYLTIGDIAPALAYANQSIDLADRSGDAFQRMTMRTSMADALHQSGRQYEAESRFREAEEMQKDRQPEDSMMYSLPGFQYCDLLLSQGKYQEVLSRAEQTIEIARRYNWLLDIALDHLSLGRAYLFRALQEGSPDFTQAAEHLNQAVDGLRQAGTHHQVPRGLLGRAELYRARGEFKQAQHDIEEAMAIAERGEMGLHQADCHLEYARLYLAMGTKDRAREHLAIARKMIEQTGYHRRDREVEEMEAML